MSSTYKMQPSTHPSPARSQSTASPAASPPSYRPCTASWQLRPADLIWATDSRPAPQSLRVTSGGLWKEGCSSFRERLARPSFLKPCSLASSCTSHILHSSSWSAMRHVLSSLAASLLPHPHVAKDTPGSCSICGWMGVPEATWQVVAKGSHVEQSHPVPAGDLDQADGVAGASRVRAPFHIQTKGAAVDLLRVVPQPLHHVVRGI
eukprot:CAMPEP_0202857614 /NCGR_PEP_ID=MMETSP1391-20130828/486_1 /ASSEMBLY_ACC=CAM_ASM_000867 /TAXON_ID=1034604 /ORGANISM="Chlamydomonas leiostraca, Strain SAG 11-49" /LENGTH=205 /DNA_ID=CAMNT_0049536433 /DNA_START=290 /DNA_END=907 /DNA_ORIENTATION=-